MPSIWPWRGLGVALVWPWCGLGVALGWLWAASGGLARSNEPGSDWTEESAPPNYILRARQPGPGAFGQTLLAGRPTLRRPTVSIRLCRHRQLEDAWPERGSGLFSECQAWPLCRLRHPGPWKLGRPADDP